MVGTPRSSKLDGCITDVGSCTNVGAVDGRGFFTGGSGEDFDVVCNETAVETSESAYCPCEAVGITTGAALTPAFGTSGTGGGGV